MRVLIVEDQLRLRTWLQQGLREANFVVDAAGEGEEALWYLRSNTYDAIVLDIMLPGVDGLSILQQLRGMNREDPVLLLTARDTVADRVRGLDLGADDYLVKPFAFEELVARLRALVRRGYGRRNPVLEIGALRIDTAKQRVWRNGEEIPLRAMEYKLLEYLAQRVGETVTRAAIWEHLYDFSAESTSNVVDVHISSLRRKLDEPGGESLIRTRRGLGYVLGAEE